MSATQKCIELLPKLTDEQRRDILEIVEGMARSVETQRIDRDGRRAVVRRTWGMLQGRGVPSSDEFSRQKGEEKVLEERKCLHQ